jgi:hypothetical protein
MKNILPKIVIACLGLAAIGLPLVTGRAASAPTPAPARVFELRTYTAQPGKFEAMKARFQQSILALFKKHNLEVVGFWTPTDAPNSSNTLIYILAHASREAADKNWAAFKEDPEKIRVWAETEKDGPINLKVESVYMTSLPWSPIK